MYVFKERALPVFHDSRPSFYLSGKRYLPDPVGKRGNMKSH